MTNVFDQDQRARNTLLSKGYVSRETLTLLDRFVELLRLWQSRTNLVASSSLHDVWSRHILDSAQLLQICPKARLWVDLGSGGGFPGLVIACAMREAAGHVHLVESNGKKAGFLRHVSTSLQLPCTIHAERIEACIAKLPVPDVVTARALADLDTLLSLASSLLKRGAIGLFPKGRDHAVELTKAAEHWHFSSKLHVSHTDPDARVIEIMNFQG
ncbi:MAG: 16S rRNA (guanine(527)-N(7))-methyltransferase RsmG [Rhizobiales bacterium]|nr:16S rRNA (guanine(527)-N(7))-methyltransferase RsmG [Hyphomicrobiales bacterium]